MTETTGGTRGTDGAAAAQRDARRGMVRAVAILLAVTVVFGVLAGVFFWRAGTGSDEPLALSSSRQAYEDTDNRAYLDADATAEVSEAATEIVEMLLSLDYADFDAHTEQVRARVDDEMFEEFELTAEVSREVNTQARTVTTAEVFDRGVGVRTLDGDTAVVTLIVDVQGTVDGEPLANMSSPVQMTLNRIDGEWIAVELAQL